MSEATTLHVYECSDGVEHWVARDLEHLGQLIDGEDHVEGKIYGEPADDVAMRLDDDSELELWWSDPCLEVLGATVVKQTNEYNTAWTNLIRATCAAWAASHGEGFLATTEW